jgi:NADPH:quinone reductase
MMRAVRVARYGGPEVLEVASLPRPSPGSKELLIKVAVAAVNPVDTYLRPGTNGYAPALPYTPGHDSAGTVVELGSECLKGFNIGDRVYTCRTLSGSYAEYALASESMVHRVPTESMSFAEAACIPTPYFTAWRALFRRLKIAKEDAGKTILIHGATGAVGLAALQMARRSGLKVIGTAGSEQGLELVKPLCDYALRHGGDASIPSVEEEISRITANKGVDYIVEMLGNVNLARDLKMAGKGAGICVVGSRGDISISPRDLMAKEINLTGVMLYHNDASDWEEAAKYIEEGFATGSFKAVVDTTFKGLEEAPAAHEAVIGKGGKGSSGKILIEVS